MRKRKNLLQVTSARPLKARLVAWIAGSFVLAFALSPALSAEKDEKEKCGLKQYDSIDLVLGPAPVFVPVGIEGKRGYMILELGSGISLINKDVVKTLGLPTRAPPFDVRISSGKVTQFAEFNSLTIGRTNFGRGGFLVDPRAWPDYDGVPVFGILGTEAFSLVDIELDLSRRKLNLFSRDHCPGKVVYWANAWGRAPMLKGDSGTMYFPVELEDKKVEAVFSTSMLVTRLFTDVTQRLYGFDESSPGVRTETAGGGTVNRFQAMQLTAPGMQIRNLPILLKSRGKDDSCILDIEGRTGGGAGYWNCGNVYPMALGRDVLEKLRIYFATKEKMLYFTLADGSVSEPTAAEAAKP